MRDASLENDGDDVSEFFAEAFAFLSSTFCLFMNAFSYASSRWNTAEKFEPMTVTGSASTSTPKHITRPPNVLPRIDRGFMSPYPTVVIVTQVHHIARAMLSKGLCSYSATHPRFLRYGNGHANVAERSSSASATKAHGFLEPALHASVDASPGVAAASSTEAPRGRFSSRPAGASPFGCA